MFRGCHQLIIIGTLRQLLQVLHDLKEDGHMNFEEWGLWRNPDVKKACIIILQCMREYSKDERKIVAEWVKHDMASVAEAIVFIVQSSDLE